MSACAPAPHRARRRSCSALRPRGTWIVGRRGSAVSGSGSPAPFVSAAAAAAGFLRPRPPREPRRVFFFGGASSVVSDTSAAGSGRLGRRRLDTSELRFGRDGRLLLPPAATAGAATGLRLRRRLGSRLRLRFLLSPRRRSSSTRDRLGLDGSASGSTSASGFFAREARVGFSAWASAVIGAESRPARHRPAARRPSRRARARSARSPSCRRASPRRRRRSGRPSSFADCRRRRRSGRPRRSLSSSVWPSSTGAPSTASFSTVPSSMTAKWSWATPAFPTTEEPPPRLRLDLLQAGRARADEQPGDVGVQLDLERLGARLRRGERAQLALRIDDRRRLGDDDALAGAGRALTREDLARPVRDVLARHLDEPERGDLDDVGLRPVALELLLERLLDRLPVLRVRHVDEVDDDDPADVAEPELADDFLDRLEIVLRDRVLEPLRPRTSSASRRSGPC